MNPDIYVESRHIGYAILWGFKLAVIYDGIVVLRNVLKHREIFVYIEDFIYWIYCAFFVFEHLYEIGDGHVRWYMALGVGIGMLAYKLTISKWLVKRVSFLLNKVKSFAFKTIGFLLKPFCVIGHKIKLLFRFIKNRSKLLYRMMKKKLTLAVKMLKIALCKR